MTTAMPPDLLFDLDGTLTDTDALHIAAYRRIPPTAEERALGNLPVKLDLGDDDVDYEALYGPEP